MSAFIRHCAKLRTRVISFDHIHMAILRPFSAIRGGDHVVKVIYLFDDDIRTS